MTESLDDLGFSHNRSEVDPPDIEEEIVEVAQVFSDNSISYNQLSTAVLYPNQDNQSSNFVSGSAGWQIQGDGDVEFNDGTFRGALLAGEIHIPDRNTTANSFHVQTDADTFWGCTETNFNADNNNAVAYVKNTGQAKFRSVILSENVVLSGLQSGTEIAIEGWQQNMTFSSVDTDTVSWSSGTLLLTDGTFWAISGGNTGNMTAITYIYFDKNVSLTTLQTTTTASNAVGSGKILIAVAQNNTDLTSEATFQVYGGKGGAQWSKDNIAANTLTANEIAANTITANKMSVAQLSAIAADLGSITAGTVTGATVQTALSGTRIVMNTNNFLGYNSASDAIFNVVLSGADAGDTIMGREASGQYAKWDNSAGEFLVSGNLDGKSTFTAGENIGAKKAVYLESDGKVYLTDAFNVSKVNGFVGFTTASATTNNSVIVQTSGIVTGLSGLTSGTLYYLANSGSSETVSYTNSGAAVNFNSGTSNISAARSMSFTLTKTEKVDSVTVKILKSGSPAFLYTYLLAGIIENGIRNTYGNCCILSSASTPGSQVTGSYSFVTIPFTSPIILPAGNYSLIWYQSDPGISLNDMFFIDAGGGTGKFKLRATDSASDGDSWGAVPNSNRDMYITLNISNISTSAGDITNYFFNYNKLIGIAMSSTSLYLLNNNARFAQGQITFASETSTTVTLGFSPKLVLISAISSESTILTSFGAASNAGQGCVYWTTEGYGTLQDKISKANTRNASSLVDQGSTAAIAFSSTGFVIGVSDWAGAGLYLQWVAFG